MRDLADGQLVELQGSAQKPYVLKNVGGVYSCSCPAWRNQSLPIDRRTCKHLRAWRGESAEVQRLGLPAGASLNKSTAGAKAGTSPISANGQHEPTKTVPRLLLAEVWPAGSDPIGWWLSEKLDGVRAYWDGRQFVSRQGNRFHAPDWFTAGLPEVPLDGELWIGRRQFQRTVSIVRRQDAGSHWRDVRFVLFDAPAVRGPFEERLAHLADVLKQRRPDYARVLDQVRCRGQSHLDEELSRIAAQGGEGLMLREPASSYEAGRSRTLQKLKRFHDAEARVIEHLPGRGRHQGRLGALRVALADGTEFSLGTGLSDDQRHSPPPIGTLVTFRYQELTDGGVPRFPTFVQVCGDGSERS